MGSGSSSGLRDRPLTPAAEHIEPPEGSVVVMPAPTAWPFVLALGICSVTTMFSVVNGVMLRGFSFPNSDRLISLNFIDPTSATFFGVNGQVSAMDYEELRPQQRSYDAVAAYLNGSTVNVTVDGAVGVASHR